MLKVDEISLRFEDNGRFHDDLILRIGADAWPSDSYYLLIDPQMLPDAENASKVRAVLARLMEQWRAAVDGLGDGAACYLPFDLSDESTGWLRCEAAGSELKIQRGWAGINGYSILPSDIGELLRGLPDFCPLGDEVMIDRASFLQSLREAVSGSPHAELHESFAGPSIFVYWKQSYPAPSEIAAIRRVDRSLAGKSTEEVAALLGNEDVWRIGGFFTQAQAQEIAAELRAAGLTVQIKWLG